MTNWDSSPVPCRRRILQNAKCRAFISKYLTSFLRAFQVEGDASLELTQEILVTARECEVESLYESRVHSLLACAIPADARDFALDERAAKVFQQITPQVRPGNVLDFGCGDARVGMLVQRAHGGVTLADIYVHPMIESSHLPFLYLPEKGRSSANSSSFDNVLAITVLHHCIDPITTLDEMIRITRSGGRLIFIESVYGCPLTHTGDDTNGTHDFSRMSVDEQIAVTAFFDHLYNRCLFFSEEPELKISTPYNYLSAEGWSELLAQHGLTVDEIVPLGLDHAIAPLFHVLLVASKSFTTKDE